MRYDMWITQLTIFCSYFSFSLFFGGTSLSPLPGVSSRPSANCKCICPNFKMYLFKLWNIFAELLQLLFLLAISRLEPSAGGIKSPICWLGAGCHIFQRTPDFLISRAGFLQIPETDLLNICNLSALWSADPDASLNLSHALMDLMSKKCEWINFNFNMYLLQSPNHQHLSLFIIHNIERLVSVGNKKIIRVQFGSWKCSAGLRCHQIFILNTTTTDTPYIESHQSKWL